MLKFVILLFMLPLCAAVVQSSEDAESLLERFERYVYSEENIYDPHVQAYLTASTVNADTAKRLETHRTALTLMVQKQHIAGSGLDGVKEVIMQTQAQYHKTSAERDKQEKNILVKILCEDADYGPDKAGNFAEDFVFLYWKRPDFDISEKEMFCTVLQGFFSEMEPRKRQEICGLGYKIAEEFLERHLLELKFNEPIAVVAIMRAILARAAICKKHGLSSLELADVYESLKHSRAMVIDEDMVEKTYLENWTKKTGVRKNSDDKEQAMRDVKNLKAGFALGQGYAKQFKKLWGDRHNVLSLPGRCAAVSAKERTE